MQALRILFPVMAAALFGCASYSGSGLKPGESRLQDVIALMGEPVLRWRNSDGTEQLAYPRGPAGFHTFMVRLNSDGRLRSIENVLDLRHLDLVRPGMSKDDVLRILGPSDEQRTANFPARNELAWDWRFIEGFDAPMRMIILFDATSGIVRSTQYQRESWPGAVSAVP